MEPLINLAATSLISSAIAAVIGALVGALVSKFKTVRKASGSAKQDSEELVSSSSLCYN